MLGFLRARMALEIVRSNTILLRFPYDREAKICHRLELMDGAAIELLAPWQG